MPSLEKFSFSLHFYIRLCVCVVLFVSAIELYDYFIYFRYQLWPDIWLVNSFSHYTGCPFILRRFLLLHRSFVCLFLVWQNSTCWLLLMLYIQENITIVKDNFPYVFSQEFYSFSSHFRSLIHWINFCEWFKLDKSVSFFCMWLSSFQTSFIAATTLCSLNTLGFLVKD